MQRARDRSCYERAMDQDELPGRLAADLDAAFPGFLELEQGRVYSIALRLTGQPAEAEDLAQDTFIRAYRALSSWEPARIRELAVRPWLASIVVNLGRNRARARAARPATVSLVDELAHPRIAPAETPHGRLERRASTEEWAARLLALPERYRGPVVLRHVDGLSYDEIGLALDRPAGTVKAQVHRGMGILRTMLAAEQSSLLGQAPGQPSRTAARPLEVAR